MDLLIIWVWISLVLIIASSVYLAFKKPITKEAERFWITNIIAFEIFLLVGLFSILSQTSFLFLEKYLFLLGIISIGGTLLMFAIKSDNRLSKFFFWFITLFLLEYVFIFATIFLSI